MHRTVEYSYIGAGAFEATATPDSQGPLVQFVQIRFFWGGRGGMG